MIQYGMRVHDICGRGTVTEVLDQVERLGVHYIQLAMGKSFSDIDSTAGHYSDGQACYVAEELRERGLHVSVLGCYINPAQPDESARQREVQRFIEHLKYAKLLGADLVGTETGRYSPDMRVTEETYTEECYQRVLGSFREIRDAAEKLGVRVGIEGVYNHTLCSPERIDRFLRDIASPNFDIILDSVNIITPETKGKPAEQDAIIRRCFELYGDRIAVLHLKDGDFTAEREQLFRHPGEGVFHYGELMRQLRRNKPYIVGLLENSSPERFREDCAYLDREYENAAENVR